MDDFNLFPPPPLSPPCPDEQILNHTFVKHKLYTYTHICLYTYTCVCMCVCIRTSTGRTVVSFLLMNSFQINDIQKREGRGLLTPCRSAYANNP